MNPHLAPPAPWLWSIALPLALGLLAYALRWVRASALPVGIPLGFLVLRLGGVGGFAVLTGFFLLGTLLTRLGYSRKEAKGVAEAQGGRRGASHALANCGAALVVLVARGILAGKDPTAGGPLAWIAFVGCLAAAASDTSSSEIGQLIGRHPVSPRTLRPVPVGTQGAVSLEGLLAGLAAAALLGALGRLLGLYDARGLLAVTLGGFLGNFLESLAGTWGRRALPHGGLNFANTVVGGVASVLLALLLR